ncbi:hypothetical protein BDZ94DRAFT_1265590 [Collybia nuda]|uniref:Uncharacterized protein n=1 Tax=Collybia nuda TaxID=64659 RepID=A0A9P5XZL9_9AGAR|nr:hypothetical protein BDZ94DRAFT_1265590 [Collybia nuda]
MGQAKKTKSRIRVMYYNLMVLIYILLFSRYPRCDLGGHNSTNLDAPSLMNQEMRFRFPRQGSCELPSHTRFQYAKLDWTATFEGQLFFFEFFWYGKAW